MDPLTIGLITGGSGLLSSIFNSTTSASNTQAQIAAQQSMQMQTEQFNAQQAQVQRDYETQMSNTAYQRATADMTAAGLNPMMMFGSGSMSSTPSVSSPSVGTPSIPMPQKSSPFSGLGDAVSKAVSSAVQAKTFDKMTQEVANLQTQQALTAAATKTEAEKPQLVREESLRTANQAATIANQMPAARLEGTNAQDILDMPAWLRSSLNVGGFSGSKVSQTLKPVGDAVDVLTASALKRRGMDMLQKRYDLDASKFEETYGYRPSDRQ